MFRLLSCGRDVGLFGFVREEKRPVMPGRFAVVVRAKVMTAFAAYYFQFSRNAHSVLHSPEAG